MIENEAEYAGAKRDLQYMENWLAKILSEPSRRPDFTLLGVRRMIARLHEELGRFEAHVDRPPHLPVRIRESAGDSSAQPVQEVAP